MKIQNIEDYNELAWKVYPNVEVKRWRVTVPFTDLVDHFIEFKCVIPIVRRKQTYLINYYRQYSADMDQNLEESFSRFFSTVLSEIERIKSKFIVPKKSELGSDDTITIYKLVK